MATSAQNSAVASMAAAVPAEDLAAADVEPAASLDQLLAEAQAGSERAFAALVGRFERMVHGQILRLTGSREESEDLAQNVFLQLWRVLPALTTAASLASWLKRVSVNAVISHWRHEESRKRRIEALIRQGAPARDDCPMARLIEDEERDRVRAALEMIPAELKSILTLRVYEDMSYEQLAEVLDLEIGTVRSRLFRARKKVREVLERWDRTACS